MAAWEDFVEIIAKIDPEAFAGGEDRENGGDLWAGLFAADVDPVLTPKGYGAHPVLAGILVDLDNAMVKASDEPRRLFEGLGAGLSQLAGGQTRRSSMRSKSGRQQREKKSVAPPLKSEASAKKSKG